MAKSCLRCQRGEIHTFKHGRAAYYYHGCRCETCRGAENAYSRSRDRTAYKSEWSRNWRAANPAEARAKQRRQYARDPEAAQARSRKDWALNRDKRANSQKAWRERNAGYISHAARIYREQRLGTVANSRRGPYSAAEDAIVLNGEINLFEAAHILGRSYASVSARRRRLRWNGKCKQCALGSPHEFEHGTATAYRYHCCRCGECREWRRKYAHIERHVSLRKEQAA